MVSSTDSRVVYSCTGLTEYSFSFPIYDPATDLIVWKVTWDGIETQLVYGSDFTVAATDGDYMNGGVVTTIETYTTGSLVIERSVEQTQETQYIEGDRFPAKTHESALDKLTLMVQDMRDAVGRSLKFPAADDPDLSAQLPTVAQRASNFLAFDAEGEPMAAEGVPEIPVTPFAATLLDDESAAEARGTLEIPTITAFAETLLDDADAAAARSTLGVPPTSRSISARTDLNGGGDLSADRTIAMGTPGTCTPSTANEATETTHTHKISGLPSKALSVHSTSADYTILDSDGYDAILVTTSTSDITITLPTAADNTGRVITIHKIDTGTGKVIVDGEGSEQVGYGSSLSFVLYDAADYVTLYCDGTKWWVMATNGPTLRYQGTTNVYKSAPASGTWYNMTGHSIALPIGIWLVSAQGMMYHRNNTTSSSPVSQYGACLSSSPSTSAYANLRHYFRSNNYTGWNGFGMYAVGAEDLYGCAPFTIGPERLEVASAMNLYLNIAVTWSGNAPSLVGLGGATFRYSCINARRIA